MIADFMKQIIFTEIHKNLHKTNRSLQFFVLVRWFFKRFEFSVFNQQSENLKYALKKSRLSEGKQRKAFSQSRFVSKF